jgi:hypothetical protein
MQDQCMDTCIDQVNGFGATAVNDQRYPVETSRCRTDLGRMALDSKERVARGYDAVADALPWPFFIVDRA